MRAVLLLGTNLGNKKENLETAIDAMKQQVGTFAQQSSVFITPPWGFESTNEFYNQVVVFNTELPPFDLLGELQKIEKQLGRTRKTDANGYQDRLIDIDILFYDDLVLETQRLTIPHPHLHKRRFTLEPLHEIFPDYIHPTLKKSIATLLSQCADNGVVEKLR